MVRLAAMEFGQVSVRKTENPGMERWQVVCLTLRDQIPVVFQ